MRVLIVTGIFPPDAGGPATYVSVIASALLSRGHSVSVLTLSDSPSNEAQYPYPVIRISRSLGKILRWTKTVLVVLRLSAGKDVVFASGLQLECAIATLARRRPLVIRIGGDIAWEQAVNRGWVEDSFDEFQKRRYGVRVAFLRMLRTWPLKRADAVIANSRYMESQAINWGVGQSKIVRIHNSVSVPRGIVPIALTPTCETTFITVARLVPWKGLVPLIDAMAKLSRTCLVLVGDGPLRGPLEDQVARMNLGNRVVFAGRRSRREVFGLMAAADIFVLNSQSEVFPHVVLEAMAVGLPVIATATEGTRELIADGVDGVLIDPDAPDLAEKLQRYAADPARLQSFGRAGSIKAHTSFTDNRMADMTEKVLLDAI